MNDAEVQSWFEVAQHDIDTTVLLSNENGHPDILIYHVHQAIEKLLKALLIKSNTLIEKTHNLDRLLRLSFENYPELHSVEKDILEVHYYLPLLRYPTGDQLSRNDAVECFACLKRIVGFMIELVKKYEMDVVLKMNESGALKKWEKRLE